MRAMPLWSTLLRWIITRSLAGEMMRSRLRDSLPVLVGYLVLTNTGSESRSLLRIISPVSDRVMIHRSSVDHNGVSRMWPVGELTLKPGETFRFDPSAFHVMFFDIKSPFVAGTKVPLSLLFEDEKEVTVMLEVRPLVPDAPAARHHR